jgi:hypothetical protein
MRLFQILIFFITTSCISSFPKYYNSENIMDGKYQTVHIKNRGYEGIIFPKEYLALIGSINKFTPTLEDICSAEQILRNQIKE